MFGGGCMKRLISKIYMYFKGKEMWDAKMSEKLKVTITSIPQKQYSKKTKITGYLTVIFVLLGTDEWDSMGFF